MVFYDITRPLGPGCITFPGDPPPRADPFDSGGFRMTRLNLTTHSGTHIDAPSHAVPDGGTLDSVPWERLIAPCRVIPCNRPGFTREALLSSGWMPGEGLLLQTPFSEATVFSRDYTVISPGAARVLAGRGASVVGTDAPSPDPPEGDGTAHRILLSSGIPVLELLNLSGVIPGRYLALVMPLRIPGADGAPVRVILSDRPVFMEDPR